MRIETGQAGNVPYENKNPPWKSLYELATYLQITKSNGGMDNETP